jgi:hypothetical protein
MKTATLVLISLLCSTCCLSQTTLVSWNFASSNNQANGGIAANLGKLVTNNASGTVSYPGTTSGTCTAPYILNSGWNNGANSKYWQVSFTSTNYQTLSLSFSSRGSNTGPRDWQVQYSTDGASFTDVSSGAYTINTDLVCHDYSFSLPPDLDNQTTCYLRFLVTSTVSVNGSTVASGGTNGMDNILVTAAVSLPIQLLSMNCAIHNGSNTSVDWSTATERNNSHFIIERAADGSSFEAIGRITGAGNTSSVQRYRFIDEHPVPGLNFYRLQQVDFDGQYSYSLVVSVQFGKATGIRVAPMPADDLMTVTFAEALKNEAVWQVYDMAGRLLQSGTVEAETATFNIHVASLATGTYLLRIVNGQDVIVRQFQK